MNSFVIKFLMAIKNGSLLKKKIVITEASHQCLRLSSVLYREGFIQSYKIKNKKLIVHLRYYFNKPILKNLKIVSTPSKSRFLTLNSLYKLATKKKKIFISTDKGFLTLDDCKKLKIAGKILFIC